MRFINDFLGFIFGKNDPEKIFKKFLNGNLNNVYSILYEKNLLGMIENIQNLNMTWFKGNSIEIPFESGFFLSLSIPNFPINLKYSTEFEIEKFIKENKFIVIEKSDKFIGIGKFYSISQSEKVLEDTLNYMHNIYIIDKHIFDFNIMTTNIA